MTNDEERKQQQVIIVIVVLVAIGIAALVTSVFSSDEGKAEPSSLDQRTCEIARDIAGSYGVTDTFSRSQERVADLYSGYGSAASAPISSALRDWSAGLTRGDLTLAAVGISSLDSACTAEGL